MSAPLSSAIASRTAVPVVSLDPRRWWALGIVLVAQFMYIVDLFIVNIAVPSIQKGIHASFAQAQLIIALYSLSYAVLLITGGRMGDIFGRKRTFLLGLAGFTLSSAYCGLAPTAGVLIVARILQGASGAFMTPQVVALIQVSFPAQERSRAFAVFGTVLGLAGIVGQGLGGVLLQANLFGLGWRPIFLMNVPPGLIAFCCALFLLREVRAEQQHRLDLVGVALLSSGLFLLVYPLVQGRDAGWPLWIVALLILSLPLLGGFIFYERWKMIQQSAPLLDLALFKDRAFVVGLLVTLTFYVCLQPFFLVLTLYLQIGLGDPPVTAGFTFLPMSVGFFLASTLSSKLTPLLGRALVLIGAVVMGVTMALLAGTVFFAPRTLIGSLLIPLILLSGFGQGWLVSPLITIILERVQNRHAGAASGVLLTMQQVAGSLGIALIGIIFFSLLSSHSKMIPLAQQYTHAFVISALYLTALLCATVLLVLFLPRQKAQMAKR